MRIIDPRPHLRELAAARIDKREACPRRALKAIVEASPYSYAELSRMIGRHSRYLASFARGKGPAALTEFEHRTLAQFFGLDERGLGIRDLWVDAPLSCKRLKIGDHVEHDEAV